MKVFINLSILITLSFLLFSCKSSELDPFESEPQIYFYDVGERTNAVKDSILISFAQFEPGVRETIVEIPLRYIGPVSGQDRSFKVGVDSENTTAVEGKHFELLHELYRIEAGADVGVLPVKIFSTPDLDDQTIQLSLRLEPNENFDVNFHFTNTDLNVLDLSKYRVLFSNRLLKPSWWSDFAESDYLGTFSMKKIEVIYTVTEVGLEEMEEAVLNYDWDLLRAVARETQVFINYNRSNGEEILDENNQPVNMGSYVN